MVVTRILRDSTARSTSTSAGRSNASRRHSRYVSRTIGNDGYCCATARRSAARFRCAQSGVRLPTCWRGSSSARAAASRKRAAKRDEPPSSRVTTSSISSGEGKRRSTGGGSSPPGTRNTMPSSVATASMSPARASRSLRSAAIAQGWCTRLPNGVSRQMRRSPSSSGTRSTTMVRSLGTTPAAFTSSFTYATRSPAERASRWCSFMRSAAPSAGERPAITRVSFPMRSPNAMVRPARSPCQNGIFPGMPAAGVTRTRSRVICSVRHDEAPRRNTSPSRSSKTISSSSSPTRRLDLFLRALLVLEPSPPLPFAPSLSRSPLSVPS